MIINKNLLDFTENTAIPFIHRKRNNCFVCCFNKNIKLFGKYIIFNLEDETRTYDREKPGKSVTDLYKLEDKQIHSLK